MTPNSKLPISRRLKSFCLKIRVPDDERVCDGAPW